MVMSFVLWLLAHPMGKCAAIEPGHFEEGVVCIALTPQPIRDTLYNGLTFEEWDDYQLAKYVVEARRERHRKPR